MDDDAALNLIREALCEVAPEKATHFSTLHQGTQIKDLGIDSIRIMEMLGNLEDRLGRTFAEDALASAKTLGHVMVLVQSASGQNPAR
jgi:acyl carrier protein